MDSEQGEPARWNASLRRSFHWLHDEPLEGDELTEEDQAAAQARQREHDQIMANMRQMKQIFLLLREEK